MPLVLRLTQGTPTLFGGIDWAVRGVTMGLYTRLFIGSFAVILLSVIGTYLMETYNAHSPINILWMIIIPFVGGFVMSDKPIIRIVLALSLVVVSAISSVAFVFLYWGGY
jgi:hypothetical protein